MSQEIAVRPGLPVHVEVLDGELIDDVFDCPRCSGIHGIVRRGSTDYVRCCCGSDDHDAEYCCECGHFHPDRVEHSQSPCGSYLCCVN